MKKEEIKVKIMRLLRRRKDRWWTLSQISRSTRVPYSTVVNVMKELKETLIFSRHKKDFKGYPEHIYKYEEDALDELIED